MQCWCVKEEEVAEETPHLKTGAAMDDPSPCELSSPSPGLASNVNPHAIGCTQTRCENDEPHMQGEGEGGGGRGEVAGERGEVRRCEVRGERCEVWGLRREVGGERCVVRGGRWQVRGGR